MATILESDALWSEIRRCFDKVVPSLSDVEIVPDTPFSDLGISSIEMITVVFEVEEFYDVVIVDAGLDVFETGVEFVALVQSLLEKKAVA